MNPSKKKNLLTVAGLILLLLACVAAVELIFMGLGEAIPNPVEALGDLPVVFNLVYSCLLAPVCEELCFRWMILRRLRPWGDGFALCASALLFALVHGNLYQMLYAFVVGLVLGGVLLHTGSLKGCILLHAGVNFISPSRDREILRRFFVGPVSVPLLLDATEKSM